MPRRAANIPRSTPLPFSAAVEGTPTFFLSGQVGEDPQSGALVDGGAAEQARQLLTNVMSVLAAIGKSEADVLRVGVYLADMADFAAVNAVYQEFFTAPYPARTGAVQQPGGGIVRWIAEQHGGLEGVAAQHQDDVQERQRAGEAPEAGGNGKRAGHRGSSHEIG